MNYVWVCSGRTESGDDVGPYIWAREPSQEEVDAILSRDMPDDFAEECIYADVEKVELYA